MSERVLSQRELNRAMVARQLLLERITLPIPEALERIAGIQNQYAPNAYIRLWSMLKDFRRADLTRAYEDASVVQGSLMRGTIHTVSAADYRPFIAAIRRSMGDWTARTYREPGTDRSAVAARVRKALRGRSVPRAEFQALLEGASRTAAAMSHLDAEVLRVPPQGTWEQRRAHLFALAADRIGKRRAPSEEVAIAHLVRRYLTGFGPASSKDVADFTGIPTATLLPILGLLGLDRYRDEQGKELLDVAGGLLPPPDTPAPVRFLPTWDAMLLVHARRTGILDEAYRKIIFNAKVPPSFPTILVDGRVVGTWKFADGRIAIDEFEKIPPKARRELEDEAERLAAFHA